MTVISDEMLMAYADGELPQPNRRIVSRALGQDAALALRLESFLFTRRHVLAPVYNPVVHAPIPRDLREILEVGDQAASAWGHMRSLALGRASIARFAARLRIPVWSLAAVPFFLIGAVIGWLLHVSAAAGSEAVRLHNGGLIASRALQQVLETMPSGKSVVLASVPQLIVTPKSTFASVDDRWCRQYQLSQGAAQSWGLACRMRSAEWGIELHAAATDANAHKPAGGLGMQSAISTLVHKPLEEQAEKSLIDGGWQKNP